MTHQFSLQSVNLPPRSGGNASSLVIILHGLGDSGAGILELGRIWASTLPNTAFCAPDAPFRHPALPFGFQWFGFEDLRPHVLAQGVRAAAPYLEAFIETCCTHYSVPPEKVALAGFSQGAIMALHVAPRRAQRLAGVVAYAGALLDPETLDAEIVTRPPTLLVHGALDVVVPYGAMGEAHAALERVGMMPQTLTCPLLGHSIDPEGLRAGGVFLADVLKAKGSHPDSQR